jgi:peptidoglycan-associated lipoprotein
MRKYFTLVLVVVMILPAMLFTVSCAKKSIETKPAVSEAPAQPSTVDSDAEKARIEAERLREQQEREQAARTTAARNKFVNEDIYFEFDSSAVVPAAQKVLSEKADYMRANPTLRVTVEGHCDERGTDAYNMALGQRRADAARDYLVKLGIDGSRLNTISYGEERPIAQGTTEEAWAKNRRAHFVIN